MTHLKLAQLEAKGKVKAVITQNIDGLHQQAGSKRCWSFMVNPPELLSEVRQIHGIDAILHAEGFRFVTAAIIKPDVVLYEEGLNEDVLSEAVECIAQADMLIIGGTSLSVYPAAGLVRYYQGKKLVLINKSVTAYDQYANLHFKSGLGKVRPGGCQLKYQNKIHKATFINRPNRLLLR